jgi:hypothetical protein
MKEHEGVDILIQVLLIMLLVGGELIVLHPGRFTSEEIYLYPLDRRLRVLWNWCG